MEILSSTLNHIAVLFSFILIGFVLKKKNILSDGSGRTLSRLENGIFMPAVVINTFWNNCTVENISRKWIFLVYSTALLIAGGCSLYQQWHRPFGRQRRKQCGNGGGQR